MNDINKLQLVLPTGFAILNLFFFIFATPEQPAAYVITGMLFVQVGVSIPLLGESGLFPWLRYLYGFTTLRTLWPVLYISWIMRFVTVMVLAAILWNMGISSFETVFLQRISCVVHWVYYLLVLRAVR